jgi:hypothetical protein
MPEFRSELARKAYEEFRQATPENPRFAAFRKLLTDTPAGDQRQAVFENFVRRETRDPDEITRAVELVREVEAAEVVAPPEPAPAPEPEARPAEPEGPYLDDAGALRDPAGNVVDPASEDWWDRPWANDAAKLLGPEWMAGHNPGEE